MAIDIKTPFEDDSHTFHDGALKRFFKMRKWMWATAALLVVLHLGWFDFEKIAAQVGFTYLPKSFVRLALTAVGVYLLAQAVVVSLQIAVTYRNNLQSVREATRSKLHIQLRELLQRSEDAADKAGEYVGQLAERTASDDPTANQALGDAEILYEKAKATYEGHKASVAEVEATQARSERIVTGTEILLDVARITVSIAALAYTVFAHGTVSAEWTPAPTQSISAKQP